MSEVEQPTPTRSKPLASESSSWNSYHYKLAVVVVLFSVIVYKSSLSLLWNNRRELPETYALCSRGGKNRIYTVDVENRQVECLLVSGSLVVGSGNLGGFFSSPIRLLRFFGADERVFWIERLKENFVIPVLGFSTLAVRYIPEGSIVIPGMSDSHCHILEYGASRQIRMAGADTVKGTSYIAFLSSIIARVIFLRLLIPCSNVRYCVVRGRIYRVTPRFTTEHVSCCSGLGVGSCVVGCERVAYVGKYFVSALIVMGENVNSASSIRRGQWLTLHFKL